MAKPPEALPHLREEARARQEAGQKRGGEVHLLESETGRKQRDSNAGKATQQAADQFKVSRSAVDRASKIEQATGKSQHQLAKEIGKSQPHVFRMASMWRKYGDTPEYQRPSANEAYQEFAHKPEARGKPDSQPDHSANDRVGLGLNDVSAGQRNITPTRKVIDRVRADGRSTGKIELSDYDLTALDRTPPVRRNVVGARGSGQWACSRRMA